MLKVSYSADAQLAEVSSDQVSDVWLEVRRVCEERVEEVTNNSATSFSLPWWAFLSCRAALGYVLGQHGEGLELDPQAKKLLEDALNREERYRDVPKLRPISPAALAAGLKKAGFVRKLTPEQARNVCRLVSLPAGASFSVPGAGKTTEALAYYFYKKGPSDKLLVVAPKNAFAAWEEQLALCFPSSTGIVRLRGGAVAVKGLLADNPQLMIITYQQLANVRDIIASYIGSYPSFVFLDESHRMKGGTERVQGTAVLSLSHLPVAKLVLSGTPLPNSLNDLVAQFDFLYPEVRAEEATVRDLIQPVYVRTTKAELGLPPVRRRFVDIPMSSAQRRLYDLLRSEEARQADVALRAQDRNALRAIGKSATRLLQLASNPGLLAMTPFAFPDLLREVLDEGDSPKVAYVCQRARELAAKKRKLIIWSGFIPNVELISARLKDLGADFIHGGVDAGSDEDSDTREAKIKRFHNDPNAWVLVANPAACGEGISLHSVCHEAIYVDRNYNAAQYLQSEDRIHRLGLPKGLVTNIEILSSPNSIDESVRRRLEAKVNRMASILNDRSLTIDPTSVDVDGEGLDDTDIADIVQHLRS